MTTCIHTNIIDNDDSLSEVFLQIENGRVCSITSKEPSNNYIDYMDSIMSSCFFNIHCHLGESLYHLNQDKVWSIYEYINYTEGINKKLSKADRAKFWVESAYLTASKQLENGITGICAARSADVCRKYHLNCMTGYPIMNSEKLRYYKDKGLDGFRQFKEENESTECSVGIFFHSLYANDSDSLKLAENCMEHGADFFSIHLSEDDHTRCMEIKGLYQEPVFFLDQHGLLNERTIIVHGGFLSNNELNLIKARNATIVICPLSNKTLNTKMANLERIRELGINWCIATDGLATGKSFSLIRQMKEIQLLYPHISILELIDSCTRNCAKLFNKEVYTGRISIGSEARFIRFKRNHGFTNLCDFFTTNNNPELLFF